MKTLVKKVVLAAMTSGLLACAAVRDSGPLPTVSVEFDEAAPLYRIAIKGDPSVSIIRWQLAAPSRGLPPRSAAILARTEDGAVVGCGEANEPSRASEAWSSSTRASLVTFAPLPPTGEFVTQWFNVEDLFFLFKQCVIPGRRGRYVEYKLLVEVETSRGWIRTETDWLPIVGFEPRW